MHILPSLQDQPRAWTLPEPSLVWMSPQVLQEETRTQLPSHPSLYMPNPVGGGTMSRIPNPPVLLFLEGKRDKYNPRPSPVAPQKKILSAVLGLDPLLAPSVSGEGRLTKPAKGSLQTWWSLQFIFS